MILQVSKAALYPALRRLAGAVVLRAVRDAVSLHPSPLEKGVSLNDLREDALAFLWAARDYDGWERYIFSLAGICPGRVMAKIEKEHRKERVNYAIGD